MANNEHRITHDTQRPTPDYLVIGRILGTFGWAGEIKVRPETDYPERFRTLRQILLENREGYRWTCHVQRAHVTERQIRLKLAEYNSKEEAAPLRECVILVPISQAAVLPEDSFYIHQIIGLTVRGINGEDLGEVTEVIRSPANDVYVTPKVSIPARKEFVKEIAIDKGVMIVDATMLLEVEE